jgi:alpha 1,6-mannosyltransferase
MASAPHHPIALSAVLRVLHSTANAVDWAHEHAKIVNDLRTLGRYDDMEAVKQLDVLSEPKEGGPLGVMAWTGPGVWTDAVLSYLRVKYGMLWTDLKDIRDPIRIGDVMILPGSLPLVRGLRIADVG